MALVSQSYQLLHFAGRGVVDYDPSETLAGAGIVLGDGIFFTPVEAAQMREIPSRQSPRLLAVLSLVPGKWAHAGHCPAVARGCLHRANARLEADDQTTKQLVAIRMLYDFLVVRQLVPVNPTVSVRGPKYVVKRGKTLVRSREDTKKLPESIPRDDLAGLRDRALISTMLFSFARISAVLSLKRQDFYYQGPRRWLRFHEKGGKEHEMPAHHQIEETIDEYLSKVSIDDEQPLFQRVNALIRPSAECRRPMRRKEIVLFPRTASAWRRRVDD
jgi:hypothetical protein